MAVAIALLTLGLTILDIRWSLLFFPYRQILFTNISTSRNEQKINVLSTWLRMMPPCSCKAREMRTCSLSNFTSWLNSLIGPLNQRLAENISLQRSVRFVHGKYWSCSFFFALRKTLPKNVNKDMINNYFRLPFFPSSLTFSLFFFFLIICTLEPITSRPTCLFRFRTMH